MRCVTKGELDPPLLLTSLHTLHKLCVTHLLPQSGVPGPYLGHFSSYLPPFASSLSLDLSSSSATPAFSHFRRSHMPPPSYLFSSASSGPPQFMTTNAWNHTSNCPTLPGHPRNPHYCSTTHTCFLFSCLSPQPSTSRPPPVTALSNTNNHQTHRGPSLEHQPPSFLVGTYTRPI